jgi:Holliday junction resolvase-like predicted endonuclease
MGQTLAMSSSKDKRRVVVEYLQQHGYQILRQNYIAKGGKAELVAKLKEFVVFIAINNETNPNLNQPWETIGEWKKEQLREAATMWCCEYGYEGKVRLDAITLHNDGGEIEIQHFEAL